MTSPPGTEFRAAQLAAVFSQTPLAVAIALGNAALLVFVLEQGAPSPAALLWLAAIGVTGGLRLGLARRHARGPAPTARLGGWEAASIAAVVASGLLWGGGAAYFWPAAEAARLFWLFVVGGMCLGAAALHYPHLPTVTGFLLAAGLPVAARFALDGSGRGLAAAAMTLVFLAAMFAVARRAHAQWRQVTQLRLDLTAREAELRAAHARLRQETAEHAATAASLHHAQKLEALGQLTGGVAHDFNNLLMVVLGNLALLRKRLPAEDARAAKLLETAVLGADRGTRLTQRLLAFGRRQALRPTAIALPALLAGMEALLRGSIGPGHTLALRLPADLPPVTIDHSQLELAVLNLVVNARDAMPRGGAIVISAHAAEAVPAPGEAGFAGGRFVILAVADQGEGMDEATLARATEPFFTTKAPGKGSGLGLSMVHGLAAQSGGRLVLRSRKGAGTVAELWLCLADAAPAGAVARAEAAVPAGANPLRVLLVEDDPLVRSSAAAMLEELGHAVAEAATAEAALAQLRDDAVPDLVITDHGMPGMSGVELAKALRRRDPRLPVLIATGYGEVPEAGLAGFAILGKPFGPEALGAAIAAVLGDRG